DGRRQRRDPCRSARRARGRDREVAGVVAVGEGEARLRSAVEEAVGQVRTKSMRHLSIALLLVLASTALSGDSPAAAPGRIERTAEFVKRVNDAIDRGVAWLRKTQKADGSFLDFPTFPGATTAL